MTRNIINRPGFLISSEGLNSFGEYLRDKAIAKFGKEFGPINPGVIIDSKDMWYGKVVDAAERYYFETYMVRLSPNFSGDIECNKVKVFDTAEEAQRFAKRLLNLAPLK